ncbi:MAG TPA: NAD(P)-dependent oxidoreductase [Dehalococcoidales bacterium]|nr:NAD(P)-dependent oxidoreductase [Dehalococcoidales bacterium]
MSFKVVSGIGGADAIKAELARVDAEVVLAPVWTEEDIIKSAADADAVMVGATEPYTRKAIEAMKKCRVISRTGVGYNIDVNTATENGIAVAIVTDASIDKVSDHALAFLLAFYRKIVPVDRLVRQGAWQLRRREIFEIRVPTVRLNRQTVGVIGAGRIGGAFVRKVKAFGVKVIVYQGDEKGEYRGAPPYVRGVWASFLQNDVSRIRNQILPVSPRYNYFPLPG